MAIQLDTSNEAFVGIYERFYNNFLTHVNSLPMNSLWGLWIHNIPVQNIQTFLTKNNNGHMEDWPQMPTDLSMWANTIVTDSNLQLNGLLIAQGVKTLGETLEIERSGPIKNTGYIQGLVNQGRTGFPLLKVEFMENNLSFVDFVLRPWIIAVSHKSLKDPSLKVDITVFFLAKMGHNEVLTRRKTITYHGCCPVSLDELESNYTGADMLRLRGVQFAFNTYTVGCADAGFQRIFARYMHVPSAATNEPVVNIDGSKEMIGNNKIKSISQNDIQLGQYDLAFNEKLSIQRSGKYGVIPNPNIDDDATASIKAGNIDYSKAGGIIIDPSKEISERRESNAPPMINNLHSSYRDAQVDRGGYLDRLVSDAGAFASDLLSGAVKGVITNVTSTVTGRIDQVVNQAKSSIQQAVNNEVYKANQVVAEAIGAAGESVTPNDVRYVVKTINEKDAPIHETTINPVVLGKPAYVNTNKSINQNDHRRSEQNHQDVVRNINQNDHVDKTRITYKVVQIKK